MNKRITFLFFILAMIFIQSCFSPARLKDFPQTARGFDFSKIANSKLNSENTKWSSKKEFEYYLRTNIDNDSVLIKAVNASLLSEGYKIKFNDKKNGAIIGKRGLKANEWNSIAGVYYQKVNEGYEVYINCKITQDITGGLPNNRAKELGDLICRYLKNCAQSYSVSTASPK